MRFLVLHSNLLTSVPTGLAHLPLLARLDLRDNQLRDVPPELLDAPFVRLQGNPLGEPLPDSGSPPRYACCWGRTGHSQEAGTVTLLTTHLSFRRVTRGPGNAQAVPDFRL